jgi:hypothetical protein
MAPNQNLELLAARALSSSARLRLADSLEPFAALAWSFVASIMLRMSR